MASRDTVKVLVVENDPQELAAIERGLSAQGMVVLRATDKRAGLQRFFSARPHAILIDPSAPGMPPYELLERVRSLCDIPVLMIAPPCERSEVIRAFDAGADDFVARPVHPDELGVRLRAVLRRARPEAARTGYIDRHLEVDFDAREARAAGGARVELTPLQFQLLAALVRNRHQVLTPSQLLELAWGPGVHTFERVKVQVSNVRDRLSRAGVAKEIVQTVKGVGYRYRPEPVGSRDGT
jgi:DNA-binding response OmpR family regulator